MPPNPTIKRSILKQTFSRCRMCQLSPSVQASSNANPSLLPTDHFQSSLPRLPIPKLDKTLERYLSSQRAILNQDQLAVTEKECATFARERGPQLQRELEKYALAKKNTSYVTDMWFDMYLRDRRPVVLTHNPMMVLKDSELGATYMTAFPLDMSQYPSMFNGTRIPEPEKDRFFRDPNARHLLVIRRGQLYVFDVFDEDRSWISPHQLASNIQFILSRPVADHAPGIGVITTMDRDAGFIARERLVALGNGQALKLVDSALFALVLDDEPRMDTTSSLLNFLAGPCESRWFDKSLSLILDRFGHVAVNFEHSWGDGVAVVRLCEDMIKGADADPVIHAADLSNNDSLPSPTVSRLEWFLDNRTEEEIFRPARDAYDRRRNEVVLHFTQTNSLSKKLCKEAELSPDAMMQLVFQLTFDQLHEHPAPTYESCSTAAFKHGRTETVRPATIETRRFVELMRRSSEYITSYGTFSKPVSDPVSKAELISALISCSDKHQLLTREAAMGQGWDRHLFALRHFAEADLGRSLPELYRDPSYAWINEILISTSTLPSPVFTSGGFAAVHPHGYGVGYAVRPDHCGAIVTSWRGSPRANAVEFVQAFSHSVERLAKLLRSKAAST